MQCDSCQTELEPVMVICPACGVRVRHGREELDWRQQVHETVERHKEKRRRERAKHKNDDDARQLTIFPEVSNEDEDERRVRAKHAEIKARLEARLAKSTTQSKRPRRDIGELPLGGGAVAAALPREEELASEIALDPTTAEFGTAAELEAETGVSFSDAELAADEAPPTSSDSAELWVGLGLSSPGERLLSGVIDVAFVSLIQLTLFYLTTHLVAQRIGALPTSAVVSMFVVGAVLACSYFLFFWSLSGQTLGKLLTGGRVIDPSGRALGIRRAFLRLGGVVLSTLPLGAGFLGLWVDPERRGWHDRIAGTKVVRG